METQPFPDMKADGRDGRLARERGVPGLARHPSICDRKARLRIWQDPFDTLCDIRIAT
jgi:hypothetical protein